VKYFRKQRGLTQHQLAALMRVSQSYVANVEIGMYENPTSFCVRLRPHLDDQLKKHMDDFIDVSLELFAENRMKSICSKNVRRRASQK
jgi:transcriptional regulator with XRE-family HTH domain